MLTLGKGPPETGRPFYLTHTTNQKSKPPNPPNPEENNQGVPPPVARSGYTLQVLARLRLPAGFTLLSLTQRALAKRPAPWAGAPQRIKPVEEHFSENLKSSPFVKEHFSESSKSSPFVKEHVSELTKSAPLVKEHFSESSKSSRLVKEHFSELTKSTPLVKEHFSESPKRNAMPKAKEQKVRASQT
ncbi:MAG: hypothetical protein LBJ58_03895 [Tannerellaceae bacterium]|jgi:hypothetical protein|nr:hypothetical protein [Tannerellaceae bacterium]